MNIIFRDNEYDNSRSGLYNLFYMPPKYISRRFLLLFIVLLTQSLFLVKNSEAAPLTDEASQIYDQSKTSVFQIRVINLSTKEKSSAGSGFYISPEGHMATNYHVVSDYVLKPSRYRITYIKSDGTSVDLQLIYIDVVHDLAILLNKDGAGSYLQLGDSQIIPKGERVFSMGNPFDIGMSIVEGTFNGLMEKSMYRKILFSGALNPGMSGGPAFNHKGEVIGINVSTGGDDLSFLVPVEFLKELYKKVLSGIPAHVTHWEDIIQEQLLANQDEFISELIASSWEHLTIGDFLVPGEIAAPVKCWGKSYDKEKELMIKAKTSCSSEEYIYVSADLRSANYSYWFLHHKSKKMNTFRLYNHLEEDYGGAFSFDDNDNEMHTKFQCRTEFVEIAAQTWKASLCARQYKKFKRLYDLDLIFATVDNFDSGVMGEFRAMGISQTRAKELAKKFLEEIRWQK